MIYWFLAVSINYTLIIHNSPKTPWCGICFKLGMLIVVHCVSWKQRKKMCYKLLLSNWRKIITPHGISINFFHSTLVFLWVQNKSIDHQILLLHHFQTSTMMSHSALSVSSLIHPINGCRTSCAQIDDYLHASNTRILFWFVQEV